MSKKFLANFADTSDEEELTLKTAGEKTNDSRENLDRVIEIPHDEHAI